MPRLLLALLGLAFPTLLPAAGTIDPLDNWPHWRGPLANGTSPRGKPPVKWDAKTNVAWKTALPGKGSSTPIVWGDRVFVTTAVDTGKEADAREVPTPPDAKFTKNTTPPRTYYQFLVLCLDRNSGKVLWQRTAAQRVPHEGHHNTHSYAAGSPTTDGKRLYVSFGSFGVYAFDLDGKPLWKRELGRMETRLGWGEASTPVIHRDKLYLTWDTEGPCFEIALDAGDGRTLWKVPRDEVTSWATPLLVTHKGKTQVVTPGTRQMRSYDADTGKLLWHGPGMTINCIPSPVAKDGVAYLMSGYKGSVATAVSLDATGDITANGAVQWKIDKGTPYVPSPLLAGDRLWFTQINDPLLSTVDIKTGKTVIDRARLPGLRQLYASPVAAGRRVYIPDRDGKTIVLEQADRLKVLAVNDLAECIDASPVAVGKQLLLRGEKHVYCIEEK